MPNRPGTGNSGSALNDPMRICTRRSVWFDLPTAVTQRWSTLVVFSWSPAQLFVFTGVT